MLSCSKMEQDTMAGENHGDQRAVPQRETIKDLRSSAKPAPPSGPAILNDGPESLRSSHC